MTKFTYETVVKVDGQFLDMEDVVNALNEQEEAITQLTSELVDERKEKPKKKTEVDISEVLAGKDLIIESLRTKLTEYQSDEEISNDLVEKALVITGLKRRIKELESADYVPVDADKEIRKELNDTIEQKNARITSLAKQRSVIRIMTSRIGNQCDVVKMVELMKHILKGTKPANMVELEKAMVEAGDIK